jgi:ParB/RepB/Spo0J family partition protein
LPKSKKRTSFDVDVSLIDPPNVADRIEIRPEKVRELADSIREIGLLQPLVLNECPDGSGNGASRYEIVAGHRRFLAIRSLGWDKVPARIVKLDPQAVAVARASENLQREDLSPIEEARIYERMINDLGMSYDKVAKKCGRSPGTVKRRMNALEMPVTFQEALHSRKITLTVAEELMLCADGSYREYLLEMAVEHGVTKVVARQWVDDWKKAQRRSDSSGGDGLRDPNVSEPQIIYRSCGLCAGPVDVMKMQHIEMCPDCYARLYEILKGMS